MTTGPDANEIEWQRYTNWRGPFYASRRDTRMLVPKRTGFGWTVNLAHPVGLGVTLIALALGAVAIVAALRRGG